MRDFSREEPVTLTPTALHDNKISHICRGMRWIGPKCRHRQRKGNQVGAMPTPDRDIDKGRKKDTGKEGNTGNHRKTGGTAKS